ncbi:hypothetical protein [Catenovulum agarivorans]|uniref:hypothetical protein n=1 Tax=Catenovulum agarivorans TaxID=1172192 RepID=UPI0004B381D5|nr:hypothetical protein [Catenovulum agarivorans]
MVGQQTAVLNKYARRYARFLKILLLTHAQALIKKSAKTTHQDCTGRFSQS